MNRQRASSYVVAYDLSDARERRRVEKLLHSYGFRRQYSVFVCRLIRRSKSELVTALQDLALQTGFVLLARMAAPALQCIGNAPPDPDTEFAYIV